MVFGRLLLYIFPFIKEMMLGKTPIKEAVMSHKRRLFLLVMIVLSFALNIFTVPRLFQLSTEFVSLNREYKKVEYIAQENKGLQGKVAKLETDNAALSEANANLVKKIEMLSGLIDCNKIDCAALALPVTKTPETPRDRYDYFGEIFKK